MVTNTRFTSDAIDYGTCSGLKLLSWDYPLGNGLKDWIDREKLYPITVVKNLNNSQKQDLMERHIVTCRQLLDDPQLLAPLALSVSKTKALLKEIREIL